MISLHRKTKGCVIATRKVLKEGQFQDGVFLDLKVKQKILF